MRILLLTDGMNGVLYHRILTPHIRLQLDGLAEVDACQNPDEFLTIDFKLYDIVVFSRYLGSQHLDVLIAIQKAGVPFVVDVDDYWALPKHNPAYWSYRKGIKTAIKDAMRYADGVIVTTPLLQSKAREFNKNTFIIPNCIDKTHEQFKQPKNKGDKLRFGWVGGLTHLEDLKLCSDAVNRILDKYDVEFYLCGYTGGEVWDKIYNLFDKRVKVVEGTNTFEYGHSYKHLDFVIAPLVNESFNNHKSELKILEAAAYELPIIVSDCFPYRYCEGNLGVIFSSESNWYASIEKMIESGLIEQMGKDNAEYCDRVYNLQTWNDDRIEIYKSIIRGRN